MQMSPSLEIGGAGSLDGKERTGSGTGQVRPCAPGAFSGFRPYRTIAHLGATRRVHVVCRSRVDQQQHHFNRLKEGSGDSWYAVMQTDDPKRIDEVLQLAESTIPLDEIATGPAEEMGLGPEWAHHSHLDFVLQDLRRFPGKGWPSIRTGARSPVVRNRHMALRALSPWGKDRWPTEAPALLERALQEEPDEDVRSEIETLLAGKQLEDEGEP